MTVERFAPSPTGLLHLGHAYSALTAWDAAQKTNGTFLLRMEDIDQTRARPEFETAIFEDLAWLGLSWPTPVVRQSERLNAYQTVLDDLETRGLAYPCFCTRKDIALAAPQEGPAYAPSPDVGPDGPPYPGTCRGLSAADRMRLRAARPHALRLDMRKAMAALGGAGVVKKLSFKELGAGPNGEKKKVLLTPDFLIGACGDVVLARKDAPASYHLAVVLDDAWQGVTHVTRGRDLFYATAIHRLLQALLGRPTPIYRHHALARDSEGRRLAKRDDDLSLATLRAEGATPDDVRAMAQKAVKYTSST